MTRVRRLRDLMESEGFDSEKEQGSNEKSGEQGDVLPGIGASTPDPEGRNEDGGETEDHDDLFDIGSTGQEKGADEERSNSEGATGNVPEEKGPSESGKMKALRESGSFVTKMGQAIVDELVSEEKNSYPRMKSITFLLVQLWLLVFSFSIVFGVIDGDMVFYIVSFLVLGFNATIMAAEYIGTRKKDPAERQAIVSVASVQKTLIHLGVTLWLVVIFLSFVWGWGNLGGDKAFKDCALLAFSVNLLVVIAEVLIKWKHKVSLLDEKGAASFGDEILLFIKNMSLLCITILLGAIWLGFVYGVIDGPDSYRNLTLVAFGVYLLIVISEKGEPLEEWVRKVVKK